MGGFVCVCTRGSDLRSAQALTVAGSIIESARDKRKSRDDQEHSAGAHMPRASKRRKQVHVISGLEGDREAALKDGGSKVRDAALVEDKESNVCARENSDERAAAQTE